LTNEFIKKILWLKKRKKSKTNNILKRNQYQGESINQLVEMAKQSLEGKNSEQLYSTLAKL